jgi:hypothetical protein
MPATENLCGWIVLVLGERPGAFGFGGPCAAMGKEMTNKAENKTGTMKRSEFEKRRIIYDSTDFRVYTSEAAPSN